MSNPCVFDAREKAAVPLLRSMTDGSERGTFVARKCAFPHVQAVEAWSLHTFVRHSHEVYGIGRVVSGAQRSWSGRGQVEAGPGDVITVNPGEVHDGAPIDGVRAWRMLYFEPKAIAATVTDITGGATFDFEFNDPVMTSRVQSDAFEAAFNDLTSSRVGAADGEERLILLLAGLVRDRPRPGPPDNDGFARAKSRIDDDPVVPHTLADLAQAAGMSRFQLVRGFAKVTGFTPHAYVVQRRLDEARHMLRNRMALSDTAAACGFADQSHFSRTFVQRYGLTPGAYAAAMF